MNSLRVIVYNVPGGCELEAIHAGAKAYKDMYGIEPKSVTLPAKRPESLALSDGVLSIGDLQLEIDKFNTAPGTVQVGR